MSACGGLIGKMGDLPVRFYCCDATEGLLSLPPQCLDVMVTSPPYNIGTPYGEFKDDSSRAQYLADMRAWGAAVHRSLKDNGSLFLNIDGKPSDPWVPFDVLNGLRDQFVLQNTFHWIKSIAIDAVTYGHFKPINSQRYVNQGHEYIFHLTKTGQVPLRRSALGVPYTDPSNLNRWKGAQATQVHCRGNNWFIRYETRNEKGLHPATFPVALPEMCLRLHGLPDRTDAVLVCDPFCGTGASAVACARLGFPFIGFDINAEYIAEAVRRVNSLSNQP